MKIKDLIGIGLISAVFFPVVLVIMLFATGVARLDFGLDEEVKQVSNTYLRKYNPAQDEAEIKHMKTFEALEKKKQELAEMHEEANRDIERLELLKMENSKIKDNVSSQRDALEKLVARSSEIKLKRIKALAEVYGSMRPEEAVPILLTLSDRMVAEIMQHIQEVRAKSKIMGTMGTMDVKRAASISKLLSKPEKKKS